MTSILMFVFWTLGAETVVFRNQGMLGFHFWEPLYFILGTPVIPFPPFVFDVLFLKLDIRKRVPLLLEITGDPRVFGEYKAISVWKLPDDLIGVSSGRRVSARAHIVSAKTKAS